MIHLQVTISGNTVTTVVFFMLLITSSTLLALSSRLEAQTSNISVDNNSMSYSSNGTAPTYTSVFSSDSKPYNLTYGEWTARWWQWAYAIPRNINPAYDDSGKYCSEGQSGPVWFLTSTYKHAVNRYCDVPSGKAILFTILNSECSYAEFPNLKTEQQLRQCAKEMQDTVVHVQASVDGIGIRDLGRYRVHSPLFNFTLPKDNILGLPAFTNTQSVSDGNWVFLKPLSIGEHVIYFKGDLKNVSNSSGARTSTNNTSNFAFAGPSGWGYPVIYYIAISNSSNTS